MSNEMNTIAAREFAIDSSHDRKDVESNWWEFYSNYRLKKWRRELKSISQATGITFQEVCEYIGTESSSNPGFYRKLPKTRATYIAIGMAFKLPLEIINDWLMKYGMKKKLYIKDVVGDLIWIYLIMANEKDTASGINYFRKYEECRADIEAVYLELWNEEISDSLPTISLEENMKQLRFDAEHASLINFVGNNMDAFKTAYIKPRQMLNRYVSCIIESLNKNVDTGRKVTLNTLRGYLDDSMINYLSGSYDTVNVKDGARGRRTANIKAIPKNKKAHISLCLALGMTQEDMDEYLVMMGYFPLDGVHAEEGELMNIMRKWDEQHPLRKKYVEKYIQNNAAVKISAAEEQKAVDQMLEMRRDLKYIYEITQMRLDSKGNMNKNFRRFPYLNE